MDKLLLRRILIAALTVLALVYVAYLLISANFEMYPTENAVKATVTNKISANGFIIRDETILTNDTSGVLSYQCLNGEAVNAGGEVAKIFSDEKDAVAQSNADRLESKKNSLEALQRNTVLGTMSLDIINNNIKSKLIGYLENVNNNSVSSVKNDADSLVSSISQRQIYTGKIKNFNSEIEELGAQASQLRSSAGDSIGSVITPVAGYFTEFCDGYETSVDYGSVENMTLDDLHSVKKKSVPSNAAGKVVSNVTWYVACEVSSDEAASLTVWDSSVTVLLKEASTEAIPAEIYKIQQEGDDRALVILSCDYMNNGFLEARSEPIEIGMGTYTGLRVSRRAIHDDYVTKVTYDENDNAHKEQKKVQGVYVLYGSEVQFKQISILHADEDYVICDTNPEEGVLFNGKTVSLYDKVIIKGDDLYDGKVIS